MLLKEAVREQIKAIITLFCILSDLTYKPSEALSGLQCLEEVTWCSVLRMGNSILLKLHWLWSVLMYQHQTFAGTSH